MLLDYCKAIKLYNLPKVKENVSEIKKLKGSSLLFISFTDVYRKKGVVLLAMKISVYINFIRNTSKTILNNSSCKI